MSKKHHSKKRNSPYPTKFTSTLSLISRFNSLRANKKLHIEKVHFPVLITYQNRIKLLQFYVIYWPDCVYIFYISLVLLLAALCWQGKLFFIINYILKFIVFGWRECYRFRSLCKLLNYIAIWFDFLKGNFKRKGFWWKCVNLNA